jgi:hypothetical protein
MVSRGGVDGYGRGWEVEATAGVVGGGGVSGKANSRRRVVLKDE